MSFLSGQRRITEFLGTHRELPRKQVLKQLHLEKFMVPKTPQLYFPELLEIPEDMLEALAVMPCPFRFEFPERPE